MHRQSRPPNRSDGSAAVTEGSGGGDPPAVGAGTSRSKPATDRGEQGPGSTITGGREPQCRPRVLSPTDRPRVLSPTDRPRVLSPTDGLGVFHKRSIFHLPYRRSSSGYFSFESDSQPPSPLSPRPATADRATQTPSPTCQVMLHALQRAAEARGPGTHQHHGLSLSPSSTRQQNAAGDMQAEAIGRELRLIGDDFNRVLMLRGVAGHRRVVIHPNQLPHIHQEPAVLLCVGILLLMIGRIIYSQGSMNGPQDHSQV